MHPSELRAGLLVVALVAMASCSTANVPRSRRVDALLANYASSLRLGAAAREVQEDADTTRLAHPSWAVRSVRANAGWRHHIAVTLDKGGERHGPVRRVTLLSEDMTALTLGVSRPDALRGAPHQLGCAGLSGVGRDEVLMWPAAERGGVAVTGPVSEPPGRRIVGQFVFFRGRLEPDDIEIGYTKGAGSAASDASIR